MCVKVYVMYAKTVVHVRIIYGISTKRKIKQSVSRLEYALVWSAAPPPVNKLLFPEHGL